MRTRSGLALLILMVGCQGWFTSDDPCEAVEYRVTQLLRRANQGELVDQQLAPKLADLPQELAHRCRAEAWDASTRDCFTKARSLRELLKQQCDPAAEPR